MTELRRGERVLLRRMHADDLGFFQSYRSDPDVARYQDWTVMTDAEAAGFIAHVQGVEPLLGAGRWVQIAIADLSTDKILGDMGIFLSEDQTTAELGITLAATSQRKGYAGEAMRLAIGMVFADTPVERIQGICDVRNSRSLALLKRVGFQETHEESVMDNGELITERFHELTRETHRA